MMRNMIFLLAGSFLAVALMATSGRESVPVRIDQCVDKFKIDSRVFAQSTYALREAIEKIHTGDSVAVVQARRVLADCRIRYKALEFFLAYFFPGAAVTYNMPPVVEIEEPSMEQTEPTGLQVIESLLYETDVPARKQDLLQQMELITSSAEDINSLLFHFNGNEKQLLESLRLELIRIMTLDITGYDAPLLKTGITESYTALLSVSDALHPLLEKTQGTTADSVWWYMQQSLHFLHNNPDFDSFDRLTFLTDCALPLQYHLGRWIRQTGNEINTVPALSYDAANLYSSGLFVKQAFSTAGIAESKAIVNLGRTLFFDQSLSGNGLKSCASCHQASLYYTDGLSKSQAFDEHASLARNAPSIMYSVYQYGQGWDGAVRDLEGQVKKVLSSPQEMNAKEEDIIRRLQKSAEYRNMFREVFPVPSGNGISIQNIASAIAAFVRTCTPFTAAFDRYMQGDRTALTQEEKRGFNLFMGKAQCGTCHFAPLFNGLTPPLYDLSEAEIIGVPATAQLDKPLPDTDRGRYHLYPVREYDKAFKTPGLRNVAKTAPYMHNGAFATLKQVMDFYNKGGSAGIGLALPNQTLSAQPLKLSDQEMAEIIHFMEALTDPLPPGDGGTLYPDKKHGL